MKTIICLYFSPTGNTKTIVKSLFQYDNKIKLIEFDLTLKNQRESITRFINSNNQSPDYFVIGSPVYSGKLPEIVVETLKTINGSNVSTLGIVTYGNKSYGIALSQLKNLLVKQNFNTVALGAFIGEHSFSGKFHIAENRPNKFDVKQAGLFGESVFKSDLTYLSNESYDNKIDFIAKISPQKGPKPLLDSKQCFDCSICVNNCPVEVIDVNTKMFKNKKSKKECLGCMSCVKKCPNNARSYNIPSVMEYFLNNFYFKKSKIEEKSPIMIAVNK